MNNVILEYQKKVLNEENNIEITFVIKDWNSRNKLEQIEKNKNYSVSIKEIKSKRSLQSNRLLWAIINDLAKKMNDKEESVYCNLLEDTGAKFDWWIGIKEQKEKLLEYYRAVKITRFDEKGLAVFKCYVGSSKFNISEMNQLIDKAMTWASEYGLKYDKEMYYE